MGKKSSENRLTEFSKAALKINKLRRDLTSCTAVVPGLSLSSLPPSTGRSPGSPWAVLAVVPPEPAPPHLWSLPLEAGRSVPSEVLSALSTPEVFLGPSPGSFPGALV